MKQLNVREYFVPASVDEALSTLAGYEGNVKILAGGTDIFVAEHPELDAILDISKTGLDYIKREENVLCIGSCTIYRDIITSKEIERDFTALWEASKDLADMTIRNIATVGGNICSAVPSGDSIPPMLAFNAEFVLVSRGKERLVKATEFFLGPRKTVLESDELLREIRIPIVPGHCGSAFEKIARNSVDLANANVAVFIRRSDSGLVEEGRIALGAVAPTVVRATACERVLMGKKPEGKILDKVCDKIAEAISPITNIRCTKEYRREALNVLVKRAILRAYDGAAV